jgi:hypothetical protein
VDEPKPTHLPILISKEIKEKVRKEKPKPISRRQCS